MYAMTGSITAQPGKRTMLADILVRASVLVKSMPGCHAYIVLEDINDENAVAVFEMWDDEESHDTSLKDPQVRSLIAEALPILAGAPGGGEFRVVSPI